MSRRYEIYLRPASVALAQRRIVHEVPLSYWTW